MISSLTVTGCPIEYTWNSHANELKLTYEPGCGIFSPHERTEHLLTSLPQHGTSIHSEVAEAVQCIQRGHALRYGTWVGIKGQHTDYRCKLYFEVPAGSTFKVMSELEPNADKLQDLTDLTQGSLKMIGFDAHLRSFEWYFASSIMQPLHMKQVLSMLNLSVHDKDLFLWIERLYRRPAYKRLPGDQHGYSVRFCSKRGYIFTLYLFAEDLASNDAELRDTFLRIGQDLQWDMRLYSHLTEHMRDDKARLTHGMVGITLMQHAAPVISTGFPPPFPL